jgi:hypothetical protein
VIVRVANGLIAHWREHQHIDDSGPGRSSRAAFREHGLGGGVRARGFAANSLLCRAAIGGGAIDPQAFTLVRMVSGAAVLFLLARGRRLAPRLAIRARACGLRGGSSPSPIASSARGPARSSSSGASS